MIALMPEEEEEEVHESVKNAEKLPTANAHPGSSCEGLVRELFIVQG